MQDSGMTINRGGTIHFGDLRNFGMGNNETETLLEYMLEKDMLMVVRRAPSKITDKTDILHEQWFTYNSYSGLIPSKLFGAAKDIINFYNSSPREQVIDGQEKIRQYNSTLGKLQSVAQSVYKTILDNGDDGESFIFGIIKNCNDDQLNRFLELDPYKFAEIFYDGVPTDYKFDKESNKSALADRIVRRELASMID
ncbi:MAG: hypothetical protein KAI18_04550 [Candidatus Aenigmarchaeota archaeon]|nr:hypothetical protein [Candidatus Aenigmarchaeota archaeon]